MTRERFAELIHWPKIFWLVGIVNIGAMLPQLYQIIVTRNVEALSLGMFAIYFVVQIGFGLQGYFRRDRTLLICMALSALVSAAIIVLTLMFRVS